MDNRESLTLAKPCHPGEVLREWIDGYGETVTGSAERLGVSRAKLNRILAGKGGLRANTALALEGLGWSSAKFWLRLQNEYDLAQERIKQKTA